MRRPGPPPDNQIRSSAEPHLASPESRLLKPALITGAILAGGASRRLGRDKATLRLHGKPLALWVAEALTPLVSDLWLVTNQPLPHLALGLPQLTDLIPSQGPLGGLLTALFFARTPWVLAAAVDNPFVAPPLLASLAGWASYASRPAVVCQSQTGTQPFPGLFSVKLAPRLQKFLETDRRLQIFLQTCRPHILTPDLVSALDPEGQSFFNLNDPEDLAHAEHWLRSKS